MLAVKSTPLTNVLFCTFRSASLISSIASPTVVVLNHPSIAPSVQLLSELTPNVKSIALLPPLFASRYAFVTRSCYLLDQMRF